ncbi:MAG: hypothetical protein JW937_10350 [Candidatus Omnitrophica bacterium]|nr:hypothetical protein [Candidatus Omnitrophota bacterium]
MRLNRSGAALVWMLCLLILCAAGGSVYLYTLYLGEKDSRLASEHRVNLLERQKRSTEQKVEKLREESTSLTEEIVARQTEVAALRGDFEKESRARETTELKLREQESRLKEIRTSLEAEQREKTSLAKRLEELETAREQLQSELKTAQEEKEQLARHLEQAKQAPRQAAASGPGFVPDYGVNAVPSPVTEPEADLVSLPAVDPKLVSEVLVVNREFDFVVIGLGAKDPVELGMIFDIYKDNVLVGQAQVEKIYSAMSAAAVVSGYDIKDISEGCVVRPAQGVL